MVGRPYRVAVMEELSPGKLTRAVLARQGVATHEEVVEDKETSVVSTIEVPDLMDEDERGSFGDPDQGVVLDECQSHSTLWLPTCCERLLVLSNPCWTLPVGCSLVHRGRIKGTINLYPAKGKIMAMSAATTSLEWPD